MARGVHYFSVMKAKRRVPNYRSTNRPATVRKQEMIRLLLAQAHEGLTVREVARAIGVSRQLALYHLKKMAAQYQLVMMLQPCLENGGVQFVCWDEMALAAHYTTMLRQTPVPLVRAVEARAA